MNNKAWNDRADRDLFFTILSVKNIGVISGSEWVTIGNHLRSMGYGFTNEGCRYVQSKLNFAGIHEQLHLFSLLSSNFANLLNLYDANHYRGLRF